jgi:O-antigen/teichoic acid export membrane protein
MEMYVQNLISILSGRGAREGYLAAVDQGVISLSNFLATIILARYVSPTELGVYGVGFILLRLVRAIQEGIIVQPMNVFGASMDAATYKRYGSSTSVIQVMLALFMATAAAVGGWILIKFGNDTAGPTLFSLWFPILSWQLYEYLRRSLYTRGAIPRALANTILSNGIRLGIMIWFVNLGNLTGVTGLEAIAWGSFVTIFSGLYFTRSYWTRNILNIKLTWIRNWNFGRWILGGSVANWVAVEFYPILAAGLISFAAAGAYRALQNLVAPIHLLLRAIDTFLTPRASRIYDQNGRQGLSRTLRLIYAISALPIAGLLIFAILFRETLLRLLYGQSYLLYSPGIILMALYYALWYFYSPLQSAFKATRLSQPIFIANLAAILSMFTIGILAIRSWGVYGAIAGQALNALVINIILWGVWFRVKKRPE